MSEKNLRKFFYNTKTGYTGLNKLHKDFTERFPKTKLTYKDIKNFYDKQEISQTMNDRKKEYGTIYSWGITDILQMDLLDLRNYRKFNIVKEKSVGYLLTIIDVYSRYAWVIPLNNKKDTTILLAMKKFFKNIKWRPANITTDLGSEFISKKFKNYMRKENVEMWYADTSDHNRVGIVERFNKTIRNLIKKYQNANNTLTYIDVLPDLVYNYNNSIHSTIKTTPYKVYNLEEKPFKNKPKKIKSYKILDKVRIRNKRKIFGDKDEPIFSKTIYEITKKIGNKYEVQNMSSNKILKTLQNPNNLLKVDKIEIAPNKNSNQTMRDLKELQKDIKVFNKLKRLGISQDNIIYKKRKKNKS